MISLVLLFGFGIFFTCLVWLIKPPTITFDGIELPSDPSPIAISLKGVTVNIIAKVRLYTSYVLCSRDVAGSGGEPELCVKNPA